MTRADAIAASLTAAQACQLLKLDWVSDQTRKDVVTVCGGPRRRGFHEARTRLATIIAGLEALGVVPK